MQNKDINRSYIEDRLYDLGLKYEPNGALLLDRYLESHRYYHTLEHIIDMLCKLNDLGLLNDDSMFLAAVYHDIVYDPKKSDNEEMSVLLFISHSLTLDIPEDTITKVTNLIMMTKTHDTDNADESTKVFIDADMSVLTSDLKSLIEYEHKIFKEFQFADYYTEYKPSRLKFLSELYLKDWNKYPNLKSLINYVEHRDVKIGLFAGSFNPFHLGHYDILLKAESIFDKVIIAVGVNPYKGLTEPVYEIPEKVQNRQFVRFTDMLPDLVARLGDNVTVIRGLRNSTDMEYEHTQQIFWLDLKPDMRFVNILCDKKLEHISSTSVRKLRELNQDVKKYLVN